MVFKYSCYFSYSHATGSFGQRFARNLYEGLKAELERYLEAPVYFDTDRLRAGDIFKEQTARAICESLSMVLVFTPNYFSPERTYCAREYRAMQQLEEARLRHLKKAGERGQGMIIPVVLRGWSRLPPELMKRHCYNFEDFLLSDRSMKRHAKLASDIGRIAKYIYGLATQLEAVPDAPGLDCAEFKLPEETEIQAWLGEMLPSRGAYPFPGRSRS